MRAKFKDSGPARVLDFDIETRRIGFHSAGRFAPDGCEPIAVAWKWHGSDADPIVKTLNRQWTLNSLKWMVRPLFEAMAEADVVTGHYIRKFDLPILAGVAMETGLKFPRPLVTLDTKLDLVDSAGLSKSQENLGALLGLEASKFSMNDNKWRAAARLTEEGLAEAQTRVVSDVIQHEELFTALRNAGQLGGPTIWQ